MKVKKLKKLTDRLQDWIDSMECLSCAPVPNFEYAGEVIIVRVGEFVVWNSLEDGGSPTFKECKKRFLEYVGQFNSANRNGLAPEWLCKGCSELWAIKSEETKEQASNQDVRLCPSCLAPMNFGDPQICNGCFQKFMSIGDEVPSEPPSDDHGIPQGQAEVRCVYFKDSGKFYLYEKATFPVEYFEGCIYPRQCGERLRTDKKLPGLSSGEWDGPFTIEVHNAKLGISYPELVLPVLA